MNKVTEESDKMADLFCNAQRLFKGQVKASCTLVIGNGKSVKMADFLWSTKGLTESYLKAF